MDLSVEGSHYKKSSGDLTSKKLVKESEKDLTCVSFRKTKGNIAAQPIFLVKGIGMH